MTDLVHGLGGHVADLALAAGGDRCHLGDLVSASDLAGAPLDLFDGRGHGQVDAALQLHRVDAADHPRVGTESDLLRGHRRSLLIGRLVH
jgi:hypothetical protein